MHVRARPFLQGVSERHKVQRTQRARPRARKLTANITLRRLTY
jgi:hypothetical protein